MKKLYIGNLSYNTSEADLRDEFAKYGEVTSVTILHDAVTHQPRGLRMPLGV
jgi:cold-inducible RNA-binding protein